MSTAATRVCQPNIGNQISNLGILWVVLLVHVLNAGYAFYGLANSNGGELVLCFLAFVLFNIGRWICACCDPKCGTGNEVEGFVIRRAQPDQPDPSADGNVDDPCPPAEPATRNYFDGSQANISNADRRGRGNNSRQQRRRGDADSQYVDPCGYTPTGQKLNVNKKSAIGYSNLKDDWSVDNCDANYQVPDAERLQRGQRIEKPRIVPRDIDYYMPEANFYSSVDALPLDCIEGVMNYTGLNCQQMEAARDKLVAQDKGLVPFRQVGGARQDMASINYRCRIQKPTDLEKEIADANTTVSKVVPRTRIRSFSPVPAEGRCDPLNQPPRDFRPQQMDKRPIRFVASTRGFQDYMRDADACKKPNTNITDVQRREILRNYQATTDFEDDCEQISVVRDWPLPGCTGLDESYVSQPSCDTSIVPVPNKGNTRVMQYEPPPKCKDIIDRDGYEPRQGCIVRQTKSGNKGLCLAKVPTSRDDADMPLNGPSFEAMKGALGLSPSMSSLQIINMVAVMSLVLMFINPNVFGGIKDYFIKDEKICGYFLAAASYVLFQSTKELTN